jgi:antitoxin (DNA-binding transcriptional repressor) of toxin-antitoxin stability system
VESVPAFEAKVRFGGLLDRVIGGEEIMITRHEKPPASSFLKQVGASELG